MRARALAGTFAGLLAVCLSTAAAGQGTRNRILETPSARLEFIGLKRWTLTMIQDSLARYAPGEALASHACAAILRQKLGFADAAVQYYPPGFNGLTKGYFAVPVIEPQDSALVRYKETPRDSLPDRVAWAAALAIFTERNQVFQSAIQTPAFLLGRMHADSLEPQLAPARPLLEFLLAQRTDTNRRVALWTLAHDGNTRHRALAAVVVAGFAPSDSSWWALAEALRDQEGMVSATASQVLSVLAQGDARTVDWAPAAGGIRALLDGTNLFAHNTVLDVLAATRVNPALAPALLRGGGQLVLAKLRSEDPSGSRAARRFLTQVSGRDFGANAAEWERWIGSL